MVYTQIMSPLSATEPSTSPLEAAWPGLGHASLARDAGAPRLVLEGLWGGSKAMAVAALLADAPAPALLLVPAVREIESFTRDLGSFLAALGGDPSRPIALFPPQPALWRGGRQRESEAERACLLWRLLQGEGLWVVTTPEGATTPLPSPASFRTAMLSVAPGESLPREPLLEHLIGTAGYERVESVTEVGQVSVRGQSSRKQGARSREQWRLQQTLILALSQQEKESGWHARSPRRAP